VLGFGVVGSFPLITAPIAPAGLLLCALSAGWPVVPLFGALLGGFMTLAIAPPGLFGGGVGLLAGAAGPTGDTGVDTAIGFWNLVSVKTTAVTLAVASGVVKKVPTT
jgi:hypothetical protein